MKRIVLALIAMTALVGCTKTQYSAGGKRSFTAVAAGQNTETRTYIPSPNPFDSKTDPAGKIVNWNANDKIVIYDNQAHEFTCEESGGTVTISGEVDDGFSGVYYGLYPYEAYQGFSGTVFQTRIPTNQYLASGQRWDPVAPVVVGKCNAGEDLIPFFNAQCLVALYLPAAASSVTMQIYGDDYFSGDISVDVPTLGVTVIKGYDSVTLTGDMVAKEPYYVAVTPAQAQGGFSLFIHYTEPFTINGETYEAGQYRFKNNSTSAAFGRDRIVVLDLTEATPIVMGEPLTLGSHTQQHTYLFRSYDGSCTFTKLHGGSADKLLWIDAPIYDYNKQVPAYSLDDYQINQTGWPKRNHADSDPNGWSCYSMQIGGKGPYADYFLKYDPVLQGFYMVEDEADATLFYIYYADE